MANRKHILNCIDLFVFAAATLAIAAVFYEGMTLKWYGFAGIVIICMDYSFLPATIIHLITDRKEKKVLIHVISLIMIITAVVMKIAGMEYPAILLVFWYFYIWFVYGISAAKMLLSK